MNKAMIHQEKVSDNHTDSFWYDGLIAETKNFKLWAVGDIEYHCDDPQDDSDLADMYAKNEFYLNNWFEVLQKGDDDNLSVNAEILGDYDSALECLIETQQEFEKENKNE